MWMNTRAIVLAASTSLLLSGCGEPVELRSQNADTSSQPISAGHQGPARAPGGSGSLAGLPNCEDTPVSPRRDEPVNAAHTLHDVARSTFPGAQRYLHDVWAPTEAPEWLRCVTVELAWGTTDMEAKGKADGWSLTAEAFDAARTSDAQKAVMFRDVFPAPGESPPPPGEWEPLPGRPGWYRDVAASRRGTGEDAPGVRIGWLRSGHYFELQGYVTLEEAIAIGESVQPIR